MKLLDTLKGYKKKGIFPVEVPANGIDEKGLDAVLEVLRSYEFPREEMNKIREAKRANEMLFCDLIYKIIETTGSDWVNKRGTFPKRFAKVWKKTVDFKLSSKLLGNIGSAASEHCIRQSLFRVDFTESFNWVPGDFGDHGSCFWTDNKEAKDMMKDADFWAMRFYSKDEDHPKCGIARCWIGHSEKNLVIFNAYNACEFSLLKMARILSHMMGMYYKKVSLYNYGEDSGTLYINGAQGYIIGVQADVDDINKVDFELEDQRSRYRCYSCETGLSDDQAYRAADEVWCESCFSDRFFCCPSCERPTDNDYSVSINDGDVSWCESCANNHSTRCESCDEHFTDTTCFEGINGEYCEDCAEKVMGNNTECETCNVWHSNDEIKCNDDGSWYCEDCYDENTEYERSKKDGKKKKKVTVSKAIA